WMPTSWPRAGSRSTSRETIMAFWNPSQMLRSNPYIRVAEGPREYLDDDHYRVEVVIEFEEPRSDGYHAQPDGPDGGDVWITTITSRFAVATMRGYPGGGTTDRLFLIPEADVPTWIEHIRSPRQ